jgi:hypothetical protein
MAKRTVAGKVSADRPAESLNREFGLRLAGRTGVTNKEHRQEVKVGAGPKSCSCTEEALLSRGAFDPRCFPFFALQLAHFTARSFVISRPQLLRFGNQRYRRPQLGHHRCVHVADTQLLRLESSENAWLVVYLTA